MKVSVIIPIYNVEPYLRQCVDSVLNQTYQDLEVILVDDGSTDKCPEICDEYAARDPRVVVIHKQNGRAADARRVGLQTASGDYVLFLDGDDWLDLHTIQRCVETFQAKKVSLVMFSYIKESPQGFQKMHIFDGDQLFIGTEAQDNVYRRLFGLFGKELQHPERMENVVSCCMKLYRIEDARRGRFFDTEEIGTCEDGLFNLYALHGISSVAYLDQPFYHYRKYHGSKTSTYKPQFIAQWERLFSYMETVISEFHLSNRCSRALLNRIAFSITAIGLNTLAGDGSFVEKLRTLNGYLKSGRYKVAVAQLEFRELPLGWKILMICSRLQLTLAVYGILVVIRFRLKKWR